MRAAFLIWQTCFGDRERRELRNSLPAVGCIVLRISLAAVKHNAVPIGLRQISGGKTRFMHKNPRLNPSRKSFLRWHNSETSDRPFSEPASIAGELPTRSRGRGGHCCLFINGSFFEWSPPPLTTCTPYARQRCFKSSRSGRSGACAGHKYLCSGHGLLSQPERHFSVVASIV
jgi:hypothetical protein